MDTKKMWQCYEFSINHPDNDFEDAGGIYIFCRLNQAHEWEPIYIGKASSLAKSLANKKPWLSAKRCGATHIHTRPAATPEQRDMITQRLIELYQPFINMQVIRAQSMQA